MKPLNFLKPIDIVEWALLNYNDPVMTSGLNLSGTVLIDIAAKAGFEGELIFVDTGYHFPKTLDLWESLRERYPQITFVKLHPQVDAGPLFESEPIRCCQINKIAPLQDYFAVKSPSALLNGRTRESSKSRAGLSVFEPGSPPRINPLINLTRRDLEEYAGIYELEVHPLYAFGFLSMGCWPCTKAVRPGENPRAGRFAGQGRSECGLWESVDDTSEAES